MSKAVKPNLDHIAEPLRGLAVAVDTLVLDPANARLHGEQNLASIKASLQRFGQRQPVVVQREGSIVRAGNGRVMAAKALGWSHMAALVVDEDSVQATAYAIADNRTSDLAEWDDEALTRLLKELPTDLRIDAGFTDDDLQQLIGGASATVVAPPMLADGDREPFRQMTFVVSDEQHGDIEAALRAAKDAGDFVDTGNENSNGNALHRMAEAYLG